ncbi:hypothetical protein BRC88_08805 [Halobacteriales archaeon QS_4_69_225]|nr:MAG: hypothetical protein BRC88_08805 [Halobacteriales archaeon QS_4_69_225]
MIPNYGEKFDAEGLFSPEEAVNVQGDGLPEVPRVVILGYQAELTEAVSRQADEPIELVRSQRVYPVTGTVGYVPVHESGVGAPVTATITENVIAAGAEVIVMLGGCAALQTEIAPDAAILPTDTIRDEGVSYHYIPGNEPVTATQPLVDSLEKSLSTAGFDTVQGTTWTTSAMYRETLPEIEHYQQNGVVSLDMESAAIWAVCQYRGVDAATVQHIGDYLTAEEWIPDTDTDWGLPKMIGPTIEAVEAYVAGL